MSSPQFSLDSFKPSKLFDLTGRVALVTGAGTGIGLAQAQGLAAAGAKVYIASRRGDMLADVVKKYGFHDYLEMDVTDKSSIESAVQSFSKKEDRLDILVSNAGGAGPTHFGADTSAPDGTTDPAKKHEPMSADDYKKNMDKNNSFESWTDIFAVNSFALFFVATAFLPLLAKGTEYGQKQQQPFTSTVISTSSISSIVNQSQMHFAYNSSKAAVVKLTETMAYEFAYSVKEKIRVNSVAPGVVPSQMTADNRDPETSKSSLKEKLPVMSIPVGRPAREEEMASAIIYLAAGEYLHGTILSVDGGFSLSQP
ncbi:NAD(P)-binding protein [Jaminaea rosea]|uniref:NAD(P)-binding protein n=1 Tax=Jaminaea rosea TaxID=1569628 RepID=A0A316UIP1_9BASI|nr:NAD(P)-binding protein [Jaminaea rosea]PWN25177.1 NAD(P)-binding protein [Jaminaea rosea]